LESIHPLRNQSLHSNYFVQNRRSYSLQYRSLEDSYGSLSNSVYSVVVVVVVELVVLVVDVVVDVVLVVDVDVVVDVVLVDVVVVVVGFGINTPTKKSKSSQQLFCPE